MKTQSEIIEYYDNHREEDMFGFVAEVLFPYLTFDQAKKYLKPEATAEGWGDVEPLTEEHVVGEMRDYMVFAWEKAADHRGLSASRSIEKMRAWLWLLGDEELRDFADDNSNYAQYGAPTLKAISEKYGFDIPDEPRIKRMVKGLPCRDGCGEGCDS